MEVRKSIVFLCVVFSTEKNSGLHKCRKFTFPFSDLLHFACPVRDRLTDKQANTHSTVLAFGKFASILFKNMAYTLIKCLPPSTLDCRLLEQGSQ